jgi:hypothetical protein
MPDRFTQKDHTEEAGEQAKACNIFLFIVIFFITRLLRYQILYVDIYIYLALNLSGKLLRYADGKSGSLLIRDKCNMPLMYFN